MAIGTPYNFALGSVAGGGTSIVKTLGHNVSIGDLIAVVTLSSTTTSTLSSVTDSGGNSYTVIDTGLSTTNAAIGIAWAVATSALTSGSSTITATFSGSTTSLIGAIGCSGTWNNPASLDTHNHSANGLSATTATTVSTGTLAASAELVLGFGAWAAAVTGISSAGFTLGAAPSSITPAITACIFYDVVASNASVNWAPSWTTSANYVTDVISFLESSGSTTLTLSTKTLNWLARAPAVPSANALSSKTWNWVTQPPTVLTATTLSLASKSWSWVAQSPALQFVNALSTKAWNWAAQSIAANSAVSLASKAWNWTSQGINLIAGATLLTLATAAWNWIAKPIIATGASIISGAAGLATKEWIIRRRRRN